MGCSAHRGCRDRSGGAGVRSLAGLSRQEGGRGAVRASLQGCSNRSGVPLAVCAWAHGAVAIGVGSLRPATSLVGLYCDSNRDPCCHRGAQPGCLNRRHSPHSWPVVPVAIGAPCPLWVPTAPCRQPQGDGGRRSPRPGRAAPGAAGGAGGRREAREGGRGQVPRRAPAGRLLRGVQVRPRAGPTRHRPQDTLREDSNCSIPRGDSLAPSAAVPGLGTEGVVSRLGTTEALLGAGCSGHGADTAPRGWW